MKTSYDDICATDRIRLASSSDKSITKWFFLGLCAYFIAHIALRVLVSSSLEQDEAEQVLFSQWLRGTYLSKPPLYTWLQVLFFKVLGTNVFSLSLLKNSLLFSTYAFVFLSARVLLENTKLALLASLSLLLIPQISWESQRDLTHSVLVTTLSAASFYVVLSLLKSVKGKSYLWLGLAMGFGVLAKYNYILFILAVLLTLMSFEQGRFILFNRKFLISLAAALVFIVPYFYSLTSNLDVATSSVHKLNIVDQDFIVAGAVNLLVASLSFLGPLCLVYMVIFPHCFSRLFRNHPVQELCFPVQRYFLLLFGLLLAMVLFGRVTFFKDRWMQPLLFLFPLYFFIHVDGQSLSESALRRFTAIALTTAFVILILIPGRIVLGPSVGYITDFNYPYGALADKIRSYRPKPNLIIVDWSENAGNIRFQFPDSLVLAPSVGSLHPLKGNVDSNTVVFWDAREVRQMPVKLENFLREDAGIRPEELEIIYARLPYKYSKDHYALVGLGLLKEKKMKKDALE